MHFFLDQPGVSKKHKAPKNISEAIMKENSMIFGFNKKNAKLSSWQQAVNREAFECVKKDPDLLYNRGLLKVKAEDEARKTYMFKKKSGSRSTSAPQSKEAKRAKISSDDRKERLSSLSIQIDLISKQIASKQRLCTNATAMKDYALCAKLQGETRQLFKEKAELESQLRMMQIKERKSNWYKKKTNTSSNLPPPEASTPPSMDIRKLFKMKHTEVSTSSSSTGADRSQEVPASNAQNEVTEEVQVIDELAIDYVDSGSEDNVSSTVSSANTNNEAGEEFNEISTEHEEHTLPLNDEENPSNSVSSNFLA